VLSLHSPQLSHSGTPGTRVRHDANVGRLSPAGPIAGNRCKLTIHKTAKDVRFIGSDSRVFPGLDLTGIGQLP